jgi:hypothetical protein
MFVPWIISNLFKFRGPIPDTIPDLDPRIPQPYTDGKKTQTFLPLIFLACILAFSHAVQAQSQYKLTNNQKILIAESVDSVPKDEAIEVAETFFSTILHNNRGEWNKLLSQECFQEDGSPKEKINRIWEKSRLNSYSYNFSREIPPVKTNQRTFVFIARKDNKKKAEKTIVLVKEHGKWKVFSVK